ncbi:MAG: hypothetical protein WAK01_04925 [Methylocystis sp.]
MVGKLLLTTALGVAITSTTAFAAMAPDTGSATGSNTGSNSIQNAQNLPQQLQQKLTAQGFTDVKVVPDSFLVSAKDKQGFPVTMLIGPESLTVFTTVENPRQSKNAQPKD